MTMIPMPQCLVLLVIVMTWMNKLIINYYRVMGVKRKAARLEDGDKKARSEAGLMPGLGGQETEQVMLEQVLKEVKAPTIVQTNLDNWTQKIASHFATCQLQQVSSVSNIKNFPLKDAAEDVEFPGGKVTSCSPVGALKTKSLGNDDDVLCL